MNTLNMNKYLGTKWFIFYTKIRPWIACLSTLGIVVDFFEYTEIYTSNWWLLLYFFAGITQAVLAIMVFVKSKSDYVNFVKFVKGVLLFETSYIVYGQGIEQYIKNGYDIGFAIVMSVILFIIVFFIWYRLNMKYFMRRISSNAMQYDGSNVDVAKIKFCRKCGFELIDDSEFCGQCGTKIVKNEETRKNEML